MTSRSSSIIICLVFSFTPDYQAALLQQNLSEFVMARGRALVRFSRGERGEDLRTELRSLRSSGAQMKMNTFLLSLDSAIAAC